ncbi:MAG: FecR family protein [Marinifilaceae bacterium]|jgi:ferric-dicitrate binding protein FerR (iron transport regulator)|nr:FecR family protein [Marinifilaceae bacterium]
MSQIDWKIIQNKLEANLSPSDEKKFNRWLNSSTAHKEYFYKVQLFYKRDMDQEYPIPDSTDLFIKKLEKRRNKRRFINLMRYAAVTVLPILSFWAYWTSSDFTSYTESIVKEESLVKKNKSNKAVLITSDGQEHRLLSDNLSNINEDVNIDINKEEQKIGIKYNKQKATAKKRFNTLKTDRGGEYVVELCDGTKVHLNCESELTYPVNFNDGVRMVKLKGEAFFDVTKDKKRPFIVQVDNMNVKVLGTSFNVMAYTDEPNIQTTLVTGKVELKVKTAKGSRKMYLTPNKQATWNKHSHKLTKEEVDVNLYTSWIDGYFRFENKSMEEIMRSISRWYDVEVFYTNENLKNKLLTGKLYRFDNIEVLTSMIEKISGIKINANNKTVVITDN